MELRKSIAQNTVSQILYCKFWREMIFALNFAKCCFFAQEVYAKEAKLCVPFLKNCAKVLRTKTLIYSLVSLCFLVFTPKCFLSPTHGISCLRPQHAVFPVPNTHCFLSPRHSVSCPQQKLIPVPKTQCFLSPTHNSSCP